jgi:hypothetical protein
MPFLPDFFLCSPYYIWGVTRIFWKNLLLLSLVVSGSESLKRGDYLHSLLSPVQFAGISIAHLFRAGKVQHHNKYHNIGNNASFAHLTPGLLGHPVHLFSEADKETNGSPKLAP